MSISLQKGQRISLSKEAPGLTQLMCGLGWDVAEQSGGGFFSALCGGQDFDLDASVLCLDSNQKLTNVKDVVYFGNLKHQSGAIIHQGDNLTGEGEGDDEVIIVNLSRIPPRISKLVFVVNIYQCLQRKQDFGQVQNAFVRLVNGSNNKELARYDLSGRNYAEMTGMTLAEIYRHKNEWKMAALGNGFRVNGLEEILRKYS
ncbi:TerD family protein [Crocosphaera chwakensis]|uniref:Tellurium resistance protein terE n=1 Tax=Crocosphaera chwakensis CCY0110 TaxID=391612 RepID=A3IZJ9_9CHRO|nr:TerD family protein [Crocosphaera chwakensis]EAZ88094.1 tellurium resistance protein terE [Crocosphaera chwakensis CCY0110]